MMRPTSDDLAWCDALVDEDGDVEEAYYLFTDYVCPSAHPMSHLEVWRRRGESVWRWGADGEEEGVASSREEAMRAVVDAHAAREQES